MSRLVVVGNGMVGHRLVSAMRDRDTAGAWEITVLGAETRRAYDRVALSSYVDGASEEELRLDDDGLRCDPLVTHRLGDPVRHLDRDARRVTTASGATFGYDALVLATGSDPFVPPVPGRDLPGCFVYRTLDDLDAISGVAAAAMATTAPGRRSAVVVGGGLLGLEAARAMRTLGLSPQVVEIAPRLMPVQVDDGGGALLRSLVESQGIAVRTGVSVTGVGSDRGRLVATLSDGVELDADVVVFSAGIRAADRLARDSGLPVGERGGVLVDDRCRTGDDAVWAIGECAALDGRTYGLVAPGYAMAEVVADRLLGGPARMTPAELDTSTRLKLLGVDVASFGDAHASADGALEIVVDDPVAGTYAKLVVSAPGDADTGAGAPTLLGGVLVGDASRYAALRPLVGTPLPDDPVTLISRGGAAPDASALPDSAQICSCNGVSKGALCAAISGGAHDVPALKACTRAGTTCGSCVPALTRILEQQGVELSTALCEHFDHSRAELFEIVAGAGITSFDTLVAGHGRGAGCAVCKPAVASILATVHNGHVLDAERASLQDTNDHFLANLQRNGTYSVVPRIAGGEVTADGLIVIGEVARDFGLYTKITGGQRIDMFGARVEDLPAIWRRLVDAGFESGHAYGKSLRTVKSCVGTTWCRFGVQDSVGLAVELELRYRGLRSPHKLKSGVSGCARECAEARSKDFGVIATEDGWNLYVGGNGGFTPRHAELLVSGVDTATLVRTIDRFLMFYVRTADRLQRTAPWIESMEGGLDHLRSVVVDDSLGICADLDAAMARHVDSYADEWAGVLADPEKLSRFVSFVNAPEAPDPTIRFVQERGQNVPAPGRPDEPVLVGMPQVAAR
ncbi:nitrite reductase large subunit NirB [Pseudonocardia sp. HH130630-07]|uniref:nitrite reductase large subunit NirB n=1 Tax=Pseudonocardia sp. HH130630-07 TaxID=1690815 RepID=UPI000814F848|nr:nitrite reductase large subunit NirB [Pseudonocardia sp. HH130630-07]ANY05924.1 nitrite reductase [Pseudonocardia sp. HH130630-07]